MSDNKFRVKIDTEQLVPDRKERKYYTMALFVILILFATISAAIYAKILPSQVPLYLSLPWGEARLAASNHLLLLPLYGAFVLVANLFTSRAVKNDTLLTSTLAVSTLAVVLMVVVATCGILQSIL